MFYELFPASISDVFKNAERRRWLRFARMSEYIFLEGERDPGEVADGLLWSQEHSFRNSENSIVLVPPAIPWNALPLSLKCLIQSQCGKFSDITRWYDCPAAEIVQVFAEYWDGEPSGYVVLLSDRALIGYEPAVAV